MSLQTSDQNVSTLPEGDDPGFASFFSLVARSRPQEAPAEAPAPVRSRNFLAWYGLNGNPFPDSVNPAFFYRTRAHAEAVRTLLLTVELEAALGLLTGPSGMGKTLVSQLLLQQLDRQQCTAALVLVTPGLGKGALLREILSELSIPLPVGPPRVQDLLKILTNHITDLQVEGKRLVLVIDESHLLSAEGLHIIRTISNIEVPERKLVTCLLFGEERLSERLEHPSYESLRNRIYLREKLSPLSADDTAQYLKYRLMVAGRLTDLYTESALAAIHRHAGGICRTINKLALLSLIQGAAQGHTAIDEPLIAECAQRI